MTRKEKMDLLLSKVAEDKKEAFIAELRAAETRKARNEVLRKYNVTLTEEEEKAFNTGNEISDEELDEAAGGCCGACSTSCNTGCSCN